MTTSLLTRILQMATDEHQPPMIGGRRIKLKYAHPGGYNPPIIVVHGNQMDKLPDSYKRYLSNYYRKSLKLLVRQFAYYSKKAQTHSRVEKINSLQTNYVNVNA